MPGTPDHVAARQVNVPVHHRMFGMTNMLLHLGHDEPETLSRVLTADGCEHFLHPSPDNPGAWLLFFRLCDETKVYAGVDRCFDAAGDTRLSASDLSQ